jgi:predicted nucleic acid-binding Zn ribbon protein
MASYSYKCADCDNVLKIEASIQQKEEGSFKCTKCHSENVKQEFSVGDFLKNVFKGEEDSCCGSGGCCGEEVEEMKEEESSGCCGGGCCK